jgi:protein gp37
MSANTSIEWTEATWNPVVGCERISSGCAHCYAKAIHDRRHKAYLAGGNVLVPQYANPFEAVRPREDRLTLPLRWRKPRRVFVNSMSDLFHEDVPTEFIAAVLGVCALAQRHTFQILTKRAETMQLAMTELERAGGARHCVSTAFQLVGAQPTCDSRLDEWPLPNVWLGVSVENKRFRDERIPQLLKTSAAVHFISAEPLLEDIANDEVFSAYLYSGFTEPPHNDRLDWVIVGGESGPSARPFDLAWARSIVQQCQTAGVPVFVKQLGARPRVDGPPGDSRTWVLDLDDRKGGNPDEWPEDLRVREWPEVRA